LQNSTFQTIQFKLKVVDILVKHYSAIW